MQTIKISDAKAREIYPSAPKEIKALLEESFTPGFFLQNITNRIKTFEDACRELNVRPCDVVATSDNPDEAAYKKIKVIGKALNEGWQPDWDNHNQAKYWPWFNMSGSGLSFDGYACYCSDSTVGSRLCFKSRELAEYAGKQFISIYTEFFIIK